MNIDPKLEEATLEYLFGDGGEDPGRLVTEGATTPGYAARLAALEGELGALAEAVGVDGPGVAEARLAALREEVARWAARAPAVQDIDGVPVAEAGAEVVSLAAARAKRAPRWVAPVGGLVALAAAIILAVVFWGGDDGAQRPEAPRVTVAQAKAWAGEVGPEGMGFAGSEAPTARDRGFLAGIVADLSAPHPDGRLPGAEELDVARVIAQQAAAGLELPGGPEDVRAKVAAGCEAFLTAHEDVALCKGGLAAYQRKRGAAPSPTP